MWPISRRQIGNLGFETIDGGEKWGTMTANDLKAKGKILWCCPPES
jgi:hypothetical protein